MTFEHISRIALTAGLLLTGACFKARAQESADGPAQPAGATGWHFNIAPYLWLPTINTGLNYDLPPPLSGRLPTDVSTGAGQYLPKLHFATMFAGDAQYDRFSVMTDFMYVNVASSSTRVRSVDFSGAPSRPIPDVLDRGSSSSVKATVWTLAGGYTVFQEDWGSFDVIGGLRLLSLDASTNYRLAINVPDPSGSGLAFGGVGGVSASRTIWNGIAGVRGRIRLGDVGLFIPYYFDIGGGGSKLTWQVASGLGYQTGWAGVSILYRYLSFEQGGSNKVRNLNMGGPMMMVNFSF